MAAQRPSAPGPSPAASAGGAGVPSQGDGLGAPASVAQLIESGSGRRIDVPPLQSVTFGRRHKSTVRLGNAHVSGTHCQVFARPGAGGAWDLWIRDQSANGTYVDGRKIAKGANIRLSEGSVISFIMPSSSTPHDLPSYVVKMQPESLSQQHVADASEGVVMSQTTLPERLASVSARRRNFHQRYAKGTSLGKGAFAEVFEAVKRSTGEVVAVKILDKRRLRFSSSGSATDIIQEAHMLAGMTHPCFLRLRDVLESKDFLFLITDKADGGELFERLYSKGAYTESRARIILWRLAAAISHMHARGVVHRDLKPENVLLLDKSDDTSVVIADFGVAKAVGAEGLQSYCGTPQYLAPEVLVAQMPGATAGYGKPADMWSVGVITYILLCGSPPFHPEALKAQKHKVQWGFPARQWAAISQEAKDLITGLLAPQPEDRLTVQQLLKHPWLEEVRDLPELAALLESPTEAPPDAPSPVDDGVAAAAGSGGEAPPLMFRQGTAGGMHDDDFDPTVSAQVTRSPAPFAAAASLGGSKRTRSDPDSPSAKKPRT